jgi:hypothetical protein
MFDTAPIRWLQSFDAESVTAPSLLYPRRDFKVKVARLHLQTSYKGELI